MAGRWRVRTLLRTLLLRRSALRRRAVHWTLPKACNYYLLLRAVLRAVLWGRVAARVGGLGGRRGSGEDNDGKQRCSLGGSGRKHTRLVELE